MSDKATNRSRMPTVAEWVDELRAQGLEPKVIWAKENGYEVGKKPEKQPPTQGEKA
jgi:hypothetical protein